MRIRLESLITEGVLKCCQFYIKDDVIFSKNSTLCQFETQSQLVYVDIGLAALSKKKISDLKIALILGQG